MDSFQANDRISGRADLHMLAQAALQARYKLAVSVAAGRQISGTPATLLQQIHMCPPYRCWARSPAGSLISPVPERRIKLAVNRALIRAIQQEVAATRQAFMKSDNSRLRHSHADVIGNEPDLGKVKRLVR